MLLLGTLWTRAQDADIRPLHRAYAEATTAGARAAAAYALSDAYFARHNDSSAYYIQEAFREVDALPKDSLWANILLRRGIIFSELGDHGKAIAFLDSCMEAVAATEMLFFVAKLHYYKGVAYQATGLIGECSREYAAASEIFEKTGNQLYMANVLINWSLAYSTGNQPVEAEKLNLKAEKLLIEVGDSLSLITCLNNMGYDYENRNETTLALNAYQRAVDIATLLDEPLEAVYPLANLADHALRSGDVAKADPLARRALRFSTEGPADVVIMAWTTFAKLLIGKERYDSASVAGQRALATARRYNLPELGADAYEVLYQLEKARDDYKMALIWYDSMQQQRDSVRSVEQVAMLRNIGISNEMEKKEAENAVLIANEQTLQTRQFWILMASLVTGALLVFILAMLFRSNRRRKHHTRILQERQQIIQQANIQLSDTNKELVDLNREKDALMAIVAHDLKAPLNKILGMLNIMDAIKDDPEKMGWFREKMLQTVEGGRTLIEELVWIGSMEKEKEIPDLTACDLDDIIREVVDSFQPQAELKSIALHHEVKARLGNHLFHEEYFKRVLDNLISNALKFSKSGKRVWITQEIVDGALNLSIRDEGPGIPEAELPKLFQKFARLRNRPTGNESSTGLGLYIVKSLVEKLGGRIEVDSTEGVGTEFRLVFGA